jgi:P27 family predicted phage terminase small subunit
MGFDLMRNSKAPKTLSPEARAWWTRLSEDFEIADSAGELLLAQACESFDRMREAQEILKREGLIVRDRFQQERQHPAFLCERDARNAMLKSLRQLNLDVQVSSGIVGRSAGK